jgi:hypothetical protein
VRRQVIEFIANGIRTSHTESPSLILVPSPAVHPVPLASPVRPRSPESGRAFPAQGNPRAATVVSGASRRSIPRRSGRA